MSRIYVIHENDAWVEPLRPRSTSRGCRSTNGSSTTARSIFPATPPPGVFYNRMSASSHTRGHRYAAELTGGVLAWLESHGRRVVNSGRALQLEISKMAQYAALARHGIRVPRHDRRRRPRRDRRRPRARCTGRFITKHNRAGKGLGVRLFDDVDALERYVDGDAFEDSVDGVTLVQQYIEAPEPFITRVEFIGGKLLYAVRVDTSLGFELCPADACQVGDALCPVGETRRRRRGAAISHHRRLLASDRRPISALPRGQRHRHRRHRIHRRSRRRALHVRRQHEHQLQPRRRARGRHLRHARDRRVSRATNCARSSGARCTAARPRDGPPEHPAGARDCADGG